MKIIKVEKRKEPFTMDNGGKIYSVWALIQDDNNREYKASVRSFTDKIKLEDGEEFKAFDNCGKIEEKAKIGKNNLKYTEITIFAKKKSWGGKTQHTYTQQEYDDLFGYAFEKVYILCLSHKIDFQPSLVSTYMICAKDLGIKLSD